MRSRSRLLLCVAVVGLLGSLVVGLAGSTAASAGADRSERRAPALVVAHGGPAWSTAPPTGRPWLPALAVALVFGVLAFRPRPWSIAVMPAVRCAPVRVAAGGVGRRGPPHHR